MQKKITIPRLKMSDIIMFLDVIALLFCIIILETKSYGRYIFLALSLLAYVVCLAQTRGKMKMPVSEHQLHFLTMIFAALLSSLWAIDRSDPIQKAVSLIEILICFYGFFYYFYTTGKLSLLLKAVKWAGFFIGIYALIFYGYDTMVEAAASSGLHIDNEFSNINTISNTVATSCLLEFYDLMNKKDRLLVLFYIPSAVVIFACQSRKTFLFLFFGILGLIVLQHRGKWNILKIAAGLTAFIIIFIILSNVKAFSGMFERMQALLNMFKGEGEVDSSALTRRALVRIGFQSWLQDPIGGIGIGCSHYLAAAYAGHDYYLHNNYVEMLSGGGIIGFAAYYWFHIYLLYKIIKARKNDASLFSLALVWMLLILMLDYGMVSYYSKTQWFTLMTVYLIYQKMTAKGTNYEPIVQTEQAEKVVPVCN